MTVVLISETAGSTRQWAPGSVNTLIAPWPSAASRTQDDPEVVATKVVESLNHSLDNDGGGSVANIFCKDGYWRDHLALTWDLRTIKGGTRIAEFLRSGHNLKKIEIDLSSPDRVPKLTACNPQETVTTIQFFIVATTRYGSGRGIVSLAEEDGEWKIWTCFTSLEELKGFEEPIGANRAKGVQHGAIASRKNWLDRRRDEVEFEGKSPDVLVIGT